MNVLIIGESCTDIFIYGHANRLSPEVPCAVLDVEDKKEYPGCASNVAANLQSLGFTDFLLSQMEPMIKTRYVDLATHYQFLRVDETPKIKPFQLETVLPILDYHDAIVVADYGKGFMEDVTLNALSYYCKAAEVPIFIDTKKHDLRGISDHAYVKVNKKEFDKLTHRGSCKLIVTLGKKGAWYARTIYATKKVHVYDLMGAGDTFLATLVWAMVLKKYSVDKAIHYANSAASIVVQKIGTASVTEDEILHS